MSLDLFQDEAVNRLADIPPVEVPPAGAFDNFFVGSGKAAMRGFAKTARAVDLLGSVGPIAQDYFGKGGTEAQDQYFKEHEDVFQSAVDYWTPKPNEVGIAGEVVGGLFSMLPTVMLSPSLMVGSSLLDTAEELVKQGVSPTKSIASGTAQALGFGLGIWVPIFGQNGWQRIALGGVGFNLAQGVAMRGVSGEILEGTPAEGQFKAFDPTALTLDVLLGAAFGTMAHLNPAQRAQGAESWQRIVGWAQRLKPSDVDALATLRQAQHMNVDSAPGKMETPQDIEAHVQKMREGLDQVLNDQPVDVGSMPEAKFVPDPERIADAARRAQDLQAEADNLRSEMGLPHPDEIISQARTIGEDITQQLRSAGVDEAEASAGGMLWETFFRTAGIKYSVSPERLMQQYGPVVRRGVPEPVIPGPEWAKIERKSTIPGIKPPDTYERQDDIGTRIMTVRPTGVQSDKSIGQYDARNPDGDKIIVRVERNHLTEKTEVSLGVGVKIDVTSLLVDGLTLPEAIKRTFSTQDLPTKYIKPKTAENAPQRGLDDPEIASIVKGMAYDEAGWLSVGGKLDIGRMVEEHGPGIIDANGRPTKLGTVAFTKWIPKAEWWTGRPDKAMNEAKYATAIDKALRGEKLNKAEQRAIDNLIRIANERAEVVDIMGPENFADAAAATKDMTDGPTTKNVVDADMVERAMAIDEAKVEAAAIKAGDNDAVFMEEIRGIIDEQSAKEGKPGTATTARGQDAAQYETGQRGQALNADAVALLDSVNAGGVPAFITNQIKKIAAENGVQITQDDTPNSVIDKLRAKGQALRDTLFQMAQRDQTKTPEFKAWFGKSKVVDEKGDPIVMYHGTPRSFDTFERSQNLNAIFLTDNPKFASGWAESRAAYVGEPPNVMPLFVRAENIFDYKNTKQVDAFRKWAKVNLNLTEQKAKDLANDVATGNWEVIEGDPRVRSYVRDGGFDGTYIMEMGQRNLAVFDPSQVKSAIGNRGTFDPNNPNILYQSNKPETWYYSALARSIDSSQAKQAPAKGWKDSIKGMVAKGEVKADEVKWSGIEEWLDAQEGKVTKQQVAEFLKQGGVKVEEVTMGDETYSKLNSILEEFGFTSQRNERNGLPEYRDTNNAVIDYADLPKNIKQAIIENSKERTLQPPKFADLNLQLPGGENYRELLLTLPAPQKLPWMNDPAVVEAKRRFNEKYPAEQRGRGGRDFRRDSEELTQVIVDAENRANARAGRFELSHFDQPNILAHIRFNERTDADGKKVLFLEEIQSDWAQKGKKEGFKGRSAAEVDAELATLPEGHERVPALMDELRQARDGVPSAPFVGKTDAWVALSIKRMIRYAAENGFDKVSWTKGEQQVDRYTSGLRQAVDSIEWTKTKDGIQIVGYKTDKGRDIDIKRKVVDTTESETALSDSIGKAMAEQIIKDPNQKGTIDGENIRIDDTGMAGFYDRIVPKVANETLKKLGGGKVENVEIDMRRPEDNSWYETLTDADILNQQGFTITPEMRAKAMEGMPLFQKEGQGAAPDTAGVRGSIRFGDGKTLIELFQSADRSTFLHESAHFFLQVTRDLAMKGGAPEMAMTDWGTLSKWLGIEGGDVSREAHEKFAKGFEEYVMEGKAPSAELKGVFQQFRDWLVEIYRNMKMTLNDDVRGVMDRMLASQAEDTAARSVKPGSEPMSIEAFAEDAKQQALKDANSAIKNITGQNDADIEARVLERIRLNIEEAYKPDGAMIRDSYDAYKSKDQSTIPETGKSETSTKTPDPLATTAQRISDERGNEIISIGKDDDGKPITTTIKKYLDDARADSAQAREDSKLFEIAADCLLGGGR